MNEKRWQTTSRWSADSSRQICTRIVVEGELELLTPTHFGSGDADDLTDMPLLVDLQDNKTPLLLGTSLAGALRSYLTARQSGYRGSGGWDSVARQLFGGISQTANGRETETLSEQSALIIDDALARAGTFGIERRHGVKLDPKTRTAEDKKLFDALLWQAGAIFPLRFELTIRADDNGDLLKKGLTAALVGLSDGEITLGKRKRRGYGKVQVKEWRAKSYDLTDPRQLCDWLENGQKPLIISPTDLYQALQIDRWSTDERRQFNLTATFRLDGSLFIRSGSGKDDIGPDSLHLHSPRPQSQEPLPVLSGTALAGALRARASKIVNTLGGSRNIIDELFGPEMANDNGRERAKPQASRLHVAETIIEHPIRDLVQNRVSIDRFTSGARDTALFNEQPVWGKLETRITIDLHLINPEDADIGLLLLLLKDLWTGDLPLGGESSVGRGRLKGKEATLTLGETVWKIEEESNGRLQISGNGSQEELQNKYLAAFLEVMGHGS